jgi:hypothetical protein
MLIIIKATPKIDKIVLARSGIGIVTAIKVTPKAYKVTPFIKA